MMGIFFVGCNNGKEIEPDRDVANKIIGKWMTADRDGQASLTNKKSVFLLPYTGAGSGLRRAMDTGVEVQFDDNEKTREFVITISRREHHVKNAPSNGEMHYENAPSSAKAHQEGGETHQENAPSSEKTHQLTKKQTDIINFCSIPRSSKEIMDRLGLYNQSRNRQRHIQPLIDMGYLEPTIQGNPKAKGQKYRKTSKKI